MPLPQNLSLSKWLEVEALNNILLDLGGQALSLLCCGLACVTTNLISFSCLSYLMVHVGLVSYCNITFDAGNVGGLMLI